MGVSGSAGQRVVGTKRVLTKTLPKWARWPPCGPLPLQCEGSLGLILREGEVGDDVTRLDPNH